MNTTTEAVRAGVKGLYPGEAGVELLIRQGLAIREGAPWIRREGDVATIDADDLLKHAGVWSGGEQRVVEIACSLLGGPAVDLSDVITGIDRPSLTLVLAALAHANGSHEHSEILFTPDGAYAGLGKLGPLLDWPASAS